MSETLNNIHSALGEFYLQYLKKGGDDPKVLKEIRELLKDNSITNVIEEDENLSSIELPEDFMTDWEVTSGE